MNATIKLIWQTATNLGFNFSESDAHEMYLELKNNTIAEIQKQQRELLIAYENKVGHMDKLEAEKFVDEYLKTN